MTKTTANKNNELSMPRNAHQLELMADIEQRHPTPSEIGFGHSILTSTLFPATPPEEGTPFVSKTNRSIEYMLEPGVDSETRTREFPYGKYPRLIMAWMAKQIRAAGKHKTDNVDPERHTITIPSITQMCEEMGIGHGGKTTQRMQEQLRRLLACRISIRRTSGFVNNRSISDVVYMPLVEAVRLVDDRSNAGYSGAQFIMSKEVFERLGRESAPFDTRAANYLLNGRSVLPYDLYLWLTGSMRSLRAPLTVPWDWLYEQFGDGLNSMYRFRDTFKKALAKVRDVYPLLNVEVLPRGEGIVLLPSPPSVESH